MVVVCNGAERAKVCRDAALVSLAQYSGIVEFAVVRAKARAANFLRFLSCWRKRNKGAGI